MSKKIRVSGIAFTHTFLVIIRTNKNNNKEIVELLKTKHHHDEWFYAHLLVERIFNNLQVNWFSTELI